MLKIYDYLDIRLSQQRLNQDFYNKRLSYFLSETMESLEIDDEFEISCSLKRAFLACRTLNISINNNFKRVYRFDGTNLIIDWKISSLACYLILINCKPDRESVAKAQLFFALKQSNEGKME